MRTGVSDRTGRLRRGAGLGAGLAIVLALAGCEPAAPQAAPLAAQEAISSADFAALVERVSEPGGYFDTDNLISNESGYLKVLGTLRARDAEGGAYVGVGPDQNLSYIAALRPALAFIVDIRRDNLLQHLLLKALIERSPTRVEFLSALHGAPAPPDPGTWVDRDVSEVVAWVDSAWAGPDTPSLPASAALLDDVARAVSAYGVPLTDDDLATLRSFHVAFMRAGLSLRFTSFGRPPRPYYPTYRQLSLETDIDGEHASYLSSAVAYGVVRSLERANRIVPVVGDLSGEHALREIGAVLRERGLAVDAIYASNVEFYLWQDRTFDAWVDNVRSLPSSSDAVVIRSYFPNFGRRHPSAVEGYYATQALQPVATLARGGFESYWDVVTRDALPLR